MLDCPAVLKRLQSLDWSHGLNKEALQRVLLERNLALPNEFLSAIQPTEIFFSPEQLVQSVPEVVWTIHAERERRARGHVEIPEATEQMRQHTML